MKLLVTGGAGFIGSFLSEALISAGHSVVSLDDLSTGSDKNLINFIMKYRKIHKYSRKNIFLIIISINFIK